MPLLAVMLVKGDQVSFDLANVVIAVSRAKSVTGVDYFVFTFIIHFLKSVPDVLMIRLGIVINSSIKPSRDLLVISYLTYDYVTSNSSGDCSHWGLLGLVPIQGSQNGRAID